MPTTKPVLVNHLVGTDKVVPLEDVYAEIGDITGIVKVDSNATLPTSYQSYKRVSQLLALGILRRAKVSVLLGEKKKIRTIYIIAANCPQVSALRNQKYGGTGLIKSAYFPSTYKYG